MQSYVGIQGENYGMFPALSNDSGVTETSGSYFASVHEPRHLVTGLDILSSIIFPVLMVLLSHKLWSVYNLHKADPNCSLPLPPGSMGYPIIGETVNLVLEGADFYQKRRSSYGNIYKTHILGRPTIRVIGADNVKKILNGENTLVTIQWPESARQILGEGGLSNTTGTIHRLRRKVLQKAFGHNSLSGYVQPIQKVVMEHIQKWSDQEFIKGYTECKTLTFSVVAKVLLGFRASEEQTTVLSETFQEVMNNVLSLPINVPGSGLSKGLKARETVMAYIENSIEDIQTRGTSTDEEHNGVLHLMLESLKTGDITMDEVKDASLEMLFAGHETTTSAACSLLLHLGRTPYVVQKIRDELFENGLLSRAGEELQYEDLVGLDYVGHVVKEILRIAPPVGAGFRKALRTFEMNGMQVPKGWTIAYSIRDTQETTSLFSDGDKFNPDRWIPKPNNSRRHSLPAERYNYLPFGGGNRTCLGKEFAKLVLKILIVELVRNCDWLLLNRNPDIKYLPVPHPVDNLPLKFSIRSQFRDRAHTV